MHLRSFAPFDSFGGGYHGDGANRGFSGSPEATARIAMEFEYLVVPGVVGRTAVYSDPSVGTQISWRPPFVRRGQEATGCPEGRAIVTQRPPGWVLVQATYAGSLPLVPAAPAIDVRADVLLPTGHGGSLPQRTQLGVTVHGDAFPAFECFVRDTRGQSTLLAGFEPRFPGARALGPLLRLPGNGGRGPRGGRHMADGYVSVKLRADASIETIFDDTTPMAPDAWNRHVNERW